MKLKGVNGLHLLNSMTPLTVKLESTGLMTAPKWTSTISGKGDAFQELQLHIIAAVAQFERALILERQREGIEIAKREGKYKKVGRKPALTEVQIEDVKKRIEQGETIASVSRLYGVSRQTIYSYTG